MIPKWCLIQEIVIDGGIIAFTPGRDIYMLTLDAVEDGSYVHVHKPRQHIRGAWAKFDLISAKLTRKDSNFFSKLPSTLRNPELYIKARSIAFPAYRHPHQKIQLCYVMVALQNDIEMSYVRFLCETFKCDCKICVECPWLKGNYKNYDEELEGLYMEMAPEDQWMYNACLFFFFKIKYML